MSDASCSGREIHQLVHTLSYGDAISTEVLTLQRRFRSLGVTSEIYALHVHPKLKGKAKDAEEFPDSFNQDVILHYSLGSPLNALYRRLTAARRSLIYHNLTPARWFEGVNPRIVRDIKQGLHELPDLCRLTDLLIADSAFNAQELAQLGFEAEVLQLPIDSEKWSLPRNQGIFDLVRAEGGIHLLHVGRLAPNKCIEDIIKTFYFLHHKINKHSRLWLVGIDIDTELYSFSLKRLMHELALDGAVTFAGCMADEEIRALYESCSAYMCMSEHEGFCLPVVEAMHFGCPVIAYASSALPDTIGSGGILVTEKRHAELAELVAEVCNNSSLRTQMIAAGKARVEQLSLERFEQRVAELFLDPQSSKQRFQASPSIQKVS